MKVNLVKGSQMLQALLKCSTACAGCGEIPYGRLLAQMQGVRLVIASATSCSSIRGSPHGCAFYTAGVSAVGTQRGCRHRTAAPTVKTAKRGSRTFPVNFLGFPCWDSLQKGVRELVSENFPGVFQDHSPETRPLTTC